MTAATQLYTSAFARCIADLFANAQSYHASSEADAGFDDGEFSIPANARAQNRKALDILAEYGYSTASLEAEAQRRGLSAKWMHYSLGPVMPTEDEDPCGIFRAVDGDGHPGPVFFVTAYEVTRRYGGAEEGGWWYDCGEPVKCRVALTIADAQRAQEQLEKAGYRRTDKRYSVRGGHDYDIRIDTKPPQPFPAVRPHYE